MKFNTKSIKKSALGVISWCVATHAIAVEPLVLPSWVDGDALEKTQDIGEKIINWSAGFIGVCLVLGIFYSAWLFSTGEGDTGKKTLKGVAIGGVITTSAFGLAQLFV